MAPRLHSGGYLSLHDLLLFERSAAEARLEIYNYPLLNLVTTHSSAVLLLEEFGEMDFQFFKTKETSQRS